MYLKGQDSQNKYYFNNYAIWYFVFLSSVPPSIDGPAEESVVETISNPVTFACDATGIPPPSLTWLMNGRPIGIPTYFSLIYNCTSGIYDSLFVCVLHVNGNTSTHFFKLHAC